MNCLTEKAFEESPTGIFSYTDVLVWLDKSPNSIRGIVKRAIAAGEIVHVRRGLYCLSQKYNRQGISRNVLANMIYGPSYISMEAALAVHGMIPEAVHSVTSVSLGRARTFSTPIGYFDYRQIAQTPLLAGVMRVELANRAGSYYVAKPLKALTDYVVSHGLDWTDSSPLEDSLRIDADVLQEFSSDDFDELEDVYKSARARRFLSGLRKELSK